MIIVQVGTNNLSRPPIDDAKKRSLETAIASILKVFQKKAPDAKVFLFGIFPRNDVALSLEELKDINSRLEKKTVEHKAAFLSINEKLLGEDGKLKKGVTVDGLHLSLEGYQHWADAIIPILERELGPKKSEDAAPPPTGDPKAIRK